VISAVDTSILLDILKGDNRFGPGSAAALRRATAEGRLVVSIAVWAEVSSAYVDANEAAVAMTRLGLELVPDDISVASAAGIAWRAYRRSGGTRRRVLTDFLIGAHAAAKADRLMTRDRGFYRSHFQPLQILDPSVDRP